MENINFVAIDFETATAERHSICEVGITIVQNSKVEKSISWLVKPEGNIYDSFNINIHGITPELTANSPSFKDIWKELLPYLNDNIVIAHNTGFDMYALRDALIYNKIDFPNFSFYCSYRISKYIYEDCYSYSLPIICSHVGIETDKHHRAENDSKACAALFLKCLDKIGCDDIDSLQDIFKFRKGYFSESAFKPQLTNHSESKKEFLYKIAGDQSKFEEGNIFYGKYV